ncbi:MAG: lipoyl(octanoyl) transferase LipB [Bacteroidetes bacterium]|jgi:lipoyl(octanoyl) transferase|nr:lipoyl(octanoyl) transferase LipB [Bacteroidota bacterium]
MYQHPNKAVIFEDWGRIDYADAWNRQKDYLHRTAELKMAARRADREPVTPNYLVFCEHPPVYTLGKSGDAGHLLVPRAELEQRGVQFYQVERGGDITYHGPGQLVGYLILDLENFMTDLDRFLRSIEQAIIDVLATYGLRADRYPGYTGVWLAPHTPAERKIAAIGIKCSRWVSMHGFAFNVHTDLSYFSHIVPCGIAGKAVASLDRELAAPPTLAQVKERMRTALAAVFEWEYVENFQHLSTKNMGKSH